MNPREQQQARNEALVREVNERIERLDQSAGFADEDTTFEFLCECGQVNAEGGITCQDRVEMTLQEYEHVRAQDDRFAVVPGHENVALEKIVRRSDRFLVVDKKPGAEPIVRDDPRGASSS
jgi:hypothetical protein